MIAACKVCIGNLHHVPGVKEYFTVDLREALARKTQENHFHGNSCQFSPSTMSRLWSVSAPRVCLTFRKLALCWHWREKGRSTFSKKVWLKWWRDKKWNTTALHHGCLVRKVKIVNTSWKLCVRSLRTLTWSRGTNSRLAFGVNVNLNLFNIWHSIMNSLITSNNPTSTCSVSTLFHNGVFSWPCSFVAQRGNSGNEEVSFFTDILCSPRIWSLVQWVQLWP